MFKTKTAPTLLFIWGMKSKSKFRWPFTYLHAASLSNWKVNPLTFTNTHTHTQMVALFKETNCFKLYEITFFILKDFFLVVTWIQPLAFVKGTFSYIKTDLCMALLHSELICLNWVYLLHLFECSSLKWVSGSRL